MRDEVHGDRGPRQPALEELHRRARAPDRHRRVPGRAEPESLAVDRLVRGEHDPDIASGLRERPRERPRNVGEAAGLRERDRLGGAHADPQALAHPPAPGRPVPISTGPEVRRPQNAVLQA